MIDEGWSVGDAGFCCSIPFSPFVPLVERSVVRLFAFVSFICSFVVSDVGGAEVEAYAASKESRNKE